MTRQNAMLAQVFLAAAAAAIPTIKNPTIQAILGAIVATGVPLVASETSKSNPDGTPASVSYDKDRPVK